MAKGAVLAGNGEFLFPNSITARIPSHKLPAEPKQAAVRSSGQGNSTVPPGPSAGPRKIRPQYARLVEAGRRQPGCGEAGEGRDGRGPTSAGQDEQLAAAKAAGRGSAAACRVRRYSPGPVPDRIPVDPHDWLAVPAASDRGIRPNGSSVDDAQLAGRCRECGVRAVHAHRLPAGGVDRAVRVQGGPHEGGDRRRADRGGGLRGAGPGRDRRRSRASGRWAGRRTPGCWRGCRQRCRW